MTQVHENLYPFHLIIDENFNLINIGKSAKKLFPDLQNKDNFNAHFEIVRPRIQPDFKSFLQNQKTLFVIRDIHRPTLEMKGQAIFLIERNEILFVFTPIVRDISFFKEFKITMDDFPLFDTTLELMFALQSTKNALEDAKNQGRKLEEKVNERTLELKNKNDEILAQNEEFIQQQDQLNKQSGYLVDRNTKLQKARELVQQKNKKLKLYSKNLEEEVEQRTSELTAINNELSIQNNNLEQFAFIVAHNLRAPIARILGLVNLMKMESLVTEEIEFYIDNIHLSTIRVEEVIKDLNLILDIKKGLNQAYENNSMTEKTARVMETLKTQIEEAHASIECNFDASDYIYTISSYLENILYNLISNSIKYRDFKRKLKISISTTLDNDTICLKVKDNGIGFDAKRNKENLFKLYKRFHDHVEGKGIGLYTIKTQIEALGGKIEVESEVGKGTVSRIYFKKKI